MRKVIIIYFLQKQGGSIANALFNFGKTTDNGLPTIDWDIILMMEPSTIAGALVGTYLQVMFPEIVLTTMLSIILAYMGRETLQKAWKRYATEQAESLENNGRGVPLVAGRTSGVEGVESSSLNINTGSGPGYNYRELSGVILNIWERVYELYT